MGACPPARPDAGAGAGQLALDAPKPTRPTIVRWGTQLDVRVLQAGEAASCAGYVAKYATKSTEACGGLMHRLSASDLDRLRLRPHVERLVRTAWNLATRPELRPLRLRRWAHALGFRGHCFTKSRRYSTTFTRLRRARHEHQLRRAHGGESRDPWGRPVADGASVEHKHWAFTGTGYRTLGDAWLAESAAARARDQRRVAREGALNRPAGSARGQGHPHHLWRCAVNQQQDEVPRERYVTAREIAERFGLSPDTILRYYREGRIPGRRMPGTVRPVRFLWSEVEAAWDCRNQLSLPVEDRAA